MKEKNNKEIVYLLVCLVVVTLIYLLNHFTLYTSDDFVYRFIYKEPFPSANEQPVRSLFDLITSQMNHWKVWNGRFTGHSIVQIFMQYNKEVFNVFNSSVFLSLGILIDSLSFEIVSNKHRKHQVLYLAIIFLILWWFLPEIGKTVLWISGSGNYLWTAVLDLLWLKVVLRRNQSPYNILWTIPLAFFSGAGNENTSPAFILLISLIILYDAVSEKRVSVSRVLEIVAACIGFLLMLASPGSQKRAGDIPLFYDLSNKLANLFQMSWQKYSILYIAILVLLIYSLVKSYLNRKQFFYFLFIMCAHFACIYSLVATNELPDRVFFGASVLLCLALLILLRLILEEVLFLKKLALVFLLLLVIKFGFSYTKAFSDINSTYKVVSMQYREIYQAKENGQSTIILKRYPKPKTLFNSYNGTNNLGKSRDAWFNRWMAVYFGIDSIESRE